MYGMYYEITPIGECLFPFSYDFLPLLYWLMGTLLWSGEPSQSI